MAAAAGAGEVPAERTKFRALATWVYMEMCKSHHRAGDYDCTPSKEWVEATAAVLKASNTTPTRPDRRFPNTNQANNCWTAFNEYQLCVDKRGDKDALCLQRGRDYSTLCPEKWVDEYKESISSGTSMSVGTKVLPKAE